MRVFITGIAGFIGFHLALFLKKKNIFVMGCDNFNSFYDPQLKRKREEILSEKEIPVIESDIRNSLFLEKLILDHGITHFVHLAAHAGVRSSLKQPHSFVESNLDGFVHILEICSRHPAIKLVYASSSSVYGLNEKLPFSEEDVTDRPTCLYGATKKANELIAHTYHNIYGISTIGLRFFTVYGPWGRPDMAYFSFTKDILNGNRLQIFNAGKMRRDFTYIDDIVNGIYASIEYAGNCEIFNLGNSSPQGVLDLVACIEKLTGKKANIDLLPMQPQEVKITYADISKAQSKLGYTPSTSLFEGMKKFIEWYNAHYCEKQMI